MLRFFQIIVLHLTLLTLSLRSIAQSNIIVGSDDDIIFRDLLLANAVSSKASLTVRPVMHSIQDTSLIKGGYFFAVHSLKSVYTKKSIGVNLLPVAYQTIYNKHSYGTRNNGSFLSISGYQQKITTGLEFTSSVIDLRLNPELLWIPGHHQLSGNRFHLLGGQSMARLKAGKKIAFSAGTENLWWGPAVFNSLMMSNNAPGFPHISLHTYEPIQLPIGVIEFNLTGGHLRNAKGFPMENLNLLPIESVLPDRVNDKRYFSGFNFAYQPIFMPGFTVGINRMFQYYLSDKDRMGNTIQTYIPVLTSIFKNKAGGNNGLDEDARNRDQLINIFAKYFFKEYHLEIYGEFGWNDHKYNLRDLASNPDHAAAYNIGLRKVLPVKPMLLYAIEAEITQMAPTNSEIARGAGNWYTHGGVREGYTYLGQVIGGGVAPGDNTATLRFSRTSQKDKQQLIIERYQYDPQFNTIKWTDWRLGMMHQQYWKSMTIGAGIDFIHANNFKHTDARVLHALPSVKLLYHWK